MRTVKGINKAKLKKTFFGTKEKNGVFKVVIVYFFFILIGFVFIYPLLHMLLYSFMNESDFVNPLVINLPSSLNFTNFAEAAKVLNYVPTLLQTLLVSVVPAIIQLVATAIIAYGLARHSFPGKNICLILVVITFIIPPQVTMIPQLLMFQSLHIYDSVLSYLVPALFGQGIKSAVFILIFYMFFLMIPKSLEEAARLDGAGSIKLFIRIAMPMAIPAVIITFLISFVWYYNETTLASIYFGNVLTTLPIKLEKFLVSWQKMNPTASASGKTISEAIYMAGTFLCIAPMLAVYAFTQRYLVESMDKVGITGE